MWLSYKLKDSFQNLLSFHLKKIISEYKNNY